MYIYYTPQSWQKIILRKKQQNNKINPADKPARNMNIQYVWRVWNIRSAGKQIKVIHSKWSACLSVSQSVTQSTKKYT